MRLLGLSLLLVGCTETGAHLTLTAPDGPTSAMSFRVVLATPDAAPTINGQRVTPERYDVHSVSYYLQRTTAGGEHERIANLDGFAVRVEPDPGIAEAEFVPFVLMYDGEQATGNIIAVATFVAPDSSVPSPILVKRDEIDKYKLTVEPAVQVADTDPAGPGQVQVVTCMDDERGEFVSGVVWRPRHGGELRLVFPDDGGLDATKRGPVLDLDCDGHAVSIESSGPDCDDSRGWFHRDASETCDGFDTNCDYLRTMAVACPATTNVCADPISGAGIALCNDVGGGQLGQCQGDAQCLCGGAGSPGCIKCVVDNDLGTAPATVKPCQPGIGAFPLDPQRCSDAAACRIDIVAVRGGWKAELSSDSVTFGSSLTGAHDKFYLKVKRPEGVGAEIPGVRGMSTGEVDVVITSANGTTELWPIDLQLDTDGATNSCASSGPYQMYCTRL